MLRKKSRTQEITFQTDRVFYPSPNKTKKTKKKQTKNKKTKKQTLSFVSKSWPAAVTASNAL
jgi:hypothetical protein